MNTPVQSGKRKLSSASANLNPHDGMRNIRKSAWRASTNNTKISFVRDSSMEPCTFTRFVSSIDGPDITFSHSETVETILIAQDWKTGWEMSLQKEDYSKSGYIGQGSSKRVIYVRFIHLISAIAYLLIFEQARFGKVEYALGQMHEGGDSEENSRLLRVEYENLVQGEVFREGFEELASEYNTPLPSKLISSYNIT